MVAHENELINRIKIEIKARYCFMLETICFVAGAPLGAGAEDADASVLVHK
jgi:hypothetical protein